RRAAQPRQRCATRRPLLPPRQRLLELRELAAQRLLHHADALGIPLDHRLLPRVADLVTVLAVDPAEAEQLRVLRVRDARDPLRARVLRVTGEDALLP